jgi:hypothetical protein
MNKSAEIELAQLVKKIKRSRKNFNMKGNWLFLTTLACWSVENGFKIIAIICTLVVFSYYMRNLFRGKGKETFTSQLDKLKESYPDELSDDQISRLKSQYLSDMSIWNSSTEFFIGYSFAVMSLIYFLGFPKPLAITVFIGYWFLCACTWVIFYRRIEDNKQKEIENRLKKYEKYTTPEMIELLRIERSKFE